MNRRSFLTTLLGVSAAVISVAAVSTADAAPAPTSTAPAGALGAPEATETTPVWHRRWHRPRRRRVYVIRPRRFRRRY